ncbi:MAG: ATP-binding protein, partial [Candidatus Bipolaricaulia bacterium]
DGYAVIAISDTGEGIPQEGFDQIFQPLYTTKAKGIGLGLAIVKSLVEANGGEVSFESQVGEGTTFYVKFEVENQPLTED